jgi:excisionase family DNA binding protein
MEYISTKEAAKRWNASIRQVQRLLADNRIPDIKKHGRAWMIPKNAEKPADLRKGEKVYNRALSSRLTYIVKVTSLSIPIHNPDEILENVKEKKLRLQYEADLAYLRGDFAHVMQCFEKLGEDDATKLRASLTAVAAAISLGDYSAYLKIETYLKSFLESDYDRDISSYVELVLATVAVSVGAPRLVPKWLSEGDFSTFQSHEANLMYLIYLRTKYFMKLGEYEIALAITQTALALSPSKQGITPSDIYLRLMNALAYYCLNRLDKVRFWLLDTMQMTLPHGFITPFVELIADFGGLVEECLKKDFPDRYDAIIRQWNQTIKNWVAFHNRFTKDNITSILTLRENHIAQLAAMRVPYKEIAKRFNISVGRLKNIMLEIYEKLYISGRDELAQYVLIVNKGTGENHRPNDD